MSTASPVNALDEANFILAAHRPIQEGLELLRAFVLETYAALEEEAAHTGHFDADRLDREVRAYVPQCVRETYLEHVEAVYEAVMNRLLTPVMDGIMERCGEDVGLFECCFKRVIEEDPAGWKHAYPVDGT